MRDICVYSVMPLVDEYQVQTYIEFISKHGRGPEWRLLSDFHTFRRHYPFGPGSPPSRGSADFDGDTPPPQLHFA